jgi:hypothetical protein
VVLEAAVVVALTLQAEPLVALEGFLLPVVEAEERLDLQQDHPA